jgi:hypothetical protein
VKNEDGFGPGEALCSIAEDPALSRPHEDRERHTLVDHRPGGAPITFPTGSWLVLGVARVKAERSDACVAAYESLVEKARTSNVHAGPAVVFSSHDGRRVITMVGVRGHDGFRHLAAAWDDHHRFAQHRAIAESVSLGLFEVAASVAAAEVDPASHDAFVYEQVERPVADVSGLFASVGASSDLLGATILQGDDDRTTVILSRFAHLAAYEAFRAGRATANALGPADLSGSTSFQVGPTRTFQIL